MTKTTLMGEKIQRYNANVCIDEEQIGREGSAVMKRVQTQQTRSRHSQQIRCELRVTTAIGDDSVPTQIYTTTPLTPTRNEKGKR